jgi:hypothetical protein
MMTLEDKYPFIASWIVDGQIQIGQTDSWEPAAVVIDHGGEIWSTEEPFETLDTLFDAMELAIGQWCREHGIELVDQHNNVIPWPEN